LTVPPSPASPQPATAEEILDAIDVARGKAEFALQKRDLLGVGLRAELNRLWGTISARLGILEMRVKANSMNGAELISSAASFGIPPLSESHARRPCTTPGCSMTNSSSC
jgi:hypothetical protein